MTIRRNATISSTLRVTLLAGAACSLPILSGCGGDSESQAALKEATRSLNAVALGDATAIPTKSAEVYREAEQSLAEHAGSDDGFAEAAAVGVAMAKRGQASLASLDASKAEAAALRQARVIRGTIHEYLTMSAIAQAASTFDPSEDIAEIESIITLRRDDIANYQREMESINAEISAHEQKIEDLRAQSSEQRNQAGALELQIPRGTAQEGAKLAEQVREYTLRADQYDLEATRIEGFVAQLRPGSQEVQLNVEKADAQITLLGEAIDELRDRAAKSQSDAAEARTNANAALQRIQNAVTEYQSMRDDEVESANSKATSLSRAAISASSDARDAVKSVAAINKADAQQTLAGILMRQANGEREEAMLYQALSEAGVPGSWDSAMSEANTRADELHESGKQSYISAASSLRSARATGDTGERLNAAAQRLDMLGGLEPEPEFDDSGFDEDMDSFEDAEEMTEDSAMDMSEMTLEDILDNTPEEMRPMVAQQLQSMLDLLAETEDLDMLYGMIDQMDTQADAMVDALPAETPSEMLDQLYAGFEWIKIQIQNRIDEIEADG